MLKVFTSGAKALAVACFCAGIACADVAPPAIVGAYSNVVVTGEHAAGYSIELWQQSDLYFGLFRSTAGLAQDAPIGLLEDLRVDAKARTISFKARLSVSQESMNGDSWTPTRDLYQFEGSLYPDQITGNLVHLNTLHPESHGTQEDLKLYRSKTEEAAMPIPATYDIWTEWARQQLLARGPKW